MEDSNKKEMWALKKEARDAFNMLVEAGVDSDLAIEMILCCESEEEIYELE